MSEILDVSVVISTYNGAKVLPAALDSLLDQAAGDCRYEVIVVDNNSTDNTRQVIESYSAGTAMRLRYVFEPRQGVSYGRNAGILNAVAPIIAFTDDDVRVSCDWVRSIKALLDDHPEFDFVGGKVLPEWTAAPPGWLTDANWSPLALVDCGSAPVVVDLDRQLCLVTANLGVRRTLLDSVGLFAPELQRVKDSIGSMEDHELLIRCWRAGKQGLYAPDLIATTVVPPHRMTKEYHRRWHTGHGVFCARMRLLEDVDRTGHPGIDSSGGRESVRLFGVPGFVYRHFVGSVKNWMVSSIRRQPAEAFRNENYLRFMLSYLKTRYRDENARRRRSVPAELGSFTTNLLRKKVRTTIGRG
jgi:glycosyltransferase involved in cell wall biosynthesis